MRTHSFVLLTLVALPLAACSGAADDHSTASDDAISVGINSYTLTIDRIDADGIAENRPIYVSFSLTNHTFLTRTGYVRAETTGAGGAQTAKSNEWMSWQLAPGATTHGVLVLNAPPPGASIPLNLFYYEQEGGPRLWSTSQTINVAARVNATLDRMIVDRTRALHNDTDFATLTENIGGAPSSITVPLGDVNDGTYPLHLVGAEFDVVPGVTPPMTIGYAIANLGHATTQDEANLANEINDYAGKIIGPYLSWWSYVHDAIHTAIGYLDADCDGPTAFSSYTWPASDIVAMTDSQGDNVTTTLYQELTSQSGCGRSGQYAVSWTLHRHRAGDDFDSVTPQVARVAPSGTVPLSIQFHDSSPAPRHDVNWYVDGGAPNGWIEGSGPNVVYHAPANALPVNGYVTVVAIDGPTARVAKAFIAGPLSAVAQPPPNSK